VHATRGIHNGFLFCFTLSTLQENGSNGSSHKVGGIEI